MAILALGVAVIGGGRRISRGVAALGGKMLSACRDRMPVKFLELERDVFSRGYSVVARQAKIFLP
jgi:hypothetical protein